MTEEIPLCLCDREGNESEILPSEVVEELRRITGLSGWVYSGIRFDSSGEPHDPSWCCGAVTLWLRDDNIGDRWVFSSSASDYGTWGETVEQAYDAYVESVTRVLNYATAEMNVIRSAGKYASPDGLLGKS